MQANDNVPGSPGSLSARICVWVATGLGLGLVTPAPGTFAGLWGLGVAAAVSALSPIGAQIGVIAVLLVGAVLICDIAARALGSTGDPGAIVLDEIVVLPIVFLAGPPLNWTVLLTGYVLFRLCDIWKPGLVRVAERLPGGLGIVADDAVAAVLANLLLQLLVWAERAGGYEWLVPSV
ncbi:phosphatidylglycerophosphatase A family protein [Lacipirellula limnantheis]|nr:phosphatidylglycerophosphatase A [Lacipirellula limnantheis]